MNEPHCTHCGRPHSAERWPRTCAGCGKTTWKNPTPVAVMLVPILPGPGLLAIRRGIEPQRGRLALPGGYVDWLEGWQAAGAREVREETGLALDPALVRCFDVQSPPDGRSVLLFGISAPVDEGSLPPFVPTDETLERVVLRAPAEMAFSLHEAAARAFFAGGGTAPEVHATIRRRRTVHAYAPAPVPAPVLERALEAAVLAPNHRHTWPWRFTLPGPAARARLADLAVAEKERKRPLEPEAREAIRRSVLDPGAVVVLRQVLDPDPAVREEDYAAVACAAENLMLSLCADGWASKWTTGGVTRAPETYALLGVDPARERIVGFVWVGQPKGEAPRPERPPLAQVVARLD